MNQKRIYALIEQIQRRLNRATNLVAYSVELSTTHIQINSVLIHMGDHLRYLYRLLAGSEIDQGINLVLNENGRNAVLRLTNNYTKGHSLAPGKPVRHRFQMVEPDTLCVVMDVPIKPPLKSEAAVNAVPFPIIRKRKLWAFKIPYEHFLHFSGGYYVEMHAEVLNECLRDGSCSGMRTLQYETAECYIG